MRPAGAMGPIDGGRRPLVAVIDHGAGNLVSIEQGLLAAGADVVLAGGPTALATADAVVLPGVGAAGPAMSRLARRGLVEPIREWVSAGRPFLGICLGMQLLFESSDEDGSVTLGLFQGRSVRLDGSPTLPHIGWNQVRRRRDDPLLDGIDDGADFYFVHSYAVGPTLATPWLALATTEHGQPFVSALAQGAVYGVQFHPERSGRDGLALLANFVAIAAGIAARPSADPRTARGGTCLKGRRRGRRSHGRALQSGLPTGGSA